jgi:hypothetical protein
MKNKRGVIGLIIFFIALFLILIIGFITAIATGLITWTSAQITPIMQGLGNAEGVANFSEAAEYSFVPANKFIQALPWVVGFSYLAMLLFSIFFVITYINNPHPFLIGLYFFLVLLLIFGSIIMSNMYQDIYSGNDIVAQQLQSQTLLSFMILRSPFILALIAIIAGIFLFSRPGVENEGGYGI